MSSDMIRKLMEAALKASEEADDTPSESEATEAEQVALLREAFVLHQTPMDLKPGDYVRAKERTPMRAATNGLMIVVEVLPEPMWVTGSDEWYKSSWGERVNVRIGRYSEAEKTFIFHWCPHVYLEKVNVTQPTVQ